MDITAITARLLADTGGRARKLARPVVTLSYAQSFDGCLTDRRGSGMALSGAESKLMTHQLRAAHAGILVGIGTVLADDPRLTARLAGGPHPRPVVLDSRLRIPLESRLLARQDCPPWIVCAPDADPDRREALEKTGARLIAIPRGDEGLPDLLETLRALYTLGLDSLMVEGGARVLASFLRARLVDQAVVTVAPLWVGGLPALDGGVGRNGRYPCWDNAQSALFGCDWVVWGKLGEENYETAGPVFPGAGER